MMWRVVATAVKEISAAIQDDSSGDEREATDVDPGDGIQGAAPAVATDTGSEVPPRHMPDRLSSGPFAVEDVAVAARGRPAPSAAEMVVRAESPITGLPSSLPLKPVTSTTTRSFNSPGPSGRELGDFQQRDISSAAAPSPSGTISQLGLQPAPVGGGPRANGIGGVASSPTQETLAPSVSDETATGQVPAVDAEWEHRWLLNEVTGLRKIIAQLRRENAQLQARLNPQDTSSGSPRSGHASDSGSCCGGGPPQSQDETARVKEENRMLKSSLAKLLKQMYPLPDSDATECPSGPG